MRSTRPAAVTVIVWLTRIRIVMSVVAMTAAIYFMSPSDSEMVEGFRRGWVGASG